MYKNATRRGTVVVPKQSNALTLCTQATEHYWPLQTSPTAMPYFANAIVSDWREMECRAKDCGKSMKYTHNNSVADALFTRPLI